MNDSYDTDHSVQCWSEVFVSILPKCFFVIIIVYPYFIDISQGNVEMHLQCGGIYNNHIIVNCLQSVPVKEFWKLINKWRRYGQKQSGTLFLAHPVSVKVHLTPKLYQGPSIYLEHGFYANFYSIHKLVLTACDPEIRWLSSTDRASPTDEMLCLLTTSLWVLVTSDRKRWSAPGHDLNEKWILAYKYTGSSILRTLSLSCCTGSVTVGVHDIFHEGWYPYCTSPLDLLSIFFSVFISCSCHTLCWKHYVWSACHPAYMAKEVEFQNVSPDLIHWWKLETF